MYLIYEIISSQHDRTEYMNETEGHVTTADLTENNYCFKS